MTRNELGRRSFLGRTTAGGFAIAGAAGAAGAGTAAVAGASRAGARLELGSGVDLHTTITYRALVDAVVPETPSLGDRLGADHVPGGLEIGLAEFLITYVDGLFSFDPGILAENGNLQLATPVAHVLDTAARTLVARGDNESWTSSRRPLDLFDGDDHSTLSILLAAGPFARLTRRDRLRAVGVLDELSVELSPTDDTLFELDAGMLGQLVIGFTEMIYYSEWEGYDDYGRPLGERDHPNDPAAVQGWRQTGFPGYADGNAALRGYLGTPGSSLGGGDRWTVVDGGADPPVELTLEPGSFADDEYDTSGYEEPYPEDPAGPVDRTVGEADRTGGEADEPDGAGAADGDGDDTDGSDDPDDLDGSDDPDEESDAEDGLLEGWL